MKRTAQIIVLALLLIATGGYAQDNQKNQPGQKEVKKD